MIVTPPPGRRAPDAAVKRERAWRAAGARYRSGLAGRVLLVLAPVLGLFVGVIAWWPYHVAADERAGRAEQARGEVTNVVYVPPTRFQVEPRWLVDVRMSGRVPLAPVTVYESFRAGQKVRVAYVVGQSGKVYVERVEPLPQKGSQ